jgi:hypothetical protein
VCLNSHMLLHSLPTIVAYFSDILLVHLWHVGDEWDWVEIPQAGAVWAGLQSWWLYGLQCEHALYWICGEYQHAESCNIFVIHRAVMSMCAFVLSSCFRFTWHIFVKYKLKHLSYALIKCICYNKSPSHTACICTWKSW